MTCLDGDTNLQTYDAPKWLPSNLRPRCVLGDDYSQPSLPYTTDWYYYVFTKAFEK
ncbi:MAG TPA: hypothetical protein VFO46_23190 [Candidatus Sulfotelmatobacter sp.]|nr:hypothetical protein [Candidatus Sulfotelmatobacter sp.]